MDNSPQVLNSMDYFGMLLLELSKHIGFDLIAVAKKLQTNNDSYPENSFDTALMEIENLRSNHRKLVSMIQQACSTISDIYKKK